MESLTSDEFERMVADIGFSPVPEKHRDLIKNVALLVEEEPDDAIRKESGISDHETLLGFYVGVPRTVRGDAYGVGMTLPDRIYLFRLPILDEAHETGKAARDVIADTIWHEVAHHFGMDEYEVRKRESER